MNGNPFQSSFGGSHVQFPMPLINAKDNHKPAFIPLAKTRQGHGSPQDETINDKSRLLQYFAAHTRYNILTRFQFSTQASIFSKMRFIWSDIAIDHQGLILIF